MADWVSLGKTNYPGTPYNWSYQPPSQEEQMQQMYINWLSNYLIALSYTENPPMQADEVPEYIDRIVNNLKTGQDLMSQDYFGQFLELYQATYPSEAGYSDADLAYMEAQTANLQAKTQQILNDIAQTGEITPYQQAQLDLAMKELEMLAQQQGVDQEQLALAKEQLDFQKQQVQQQMALEYNQWLTELKANPATYLERWYAERMPRGEGKLPLQSDWIIQQGPMSPNVYKGGSGPGLYPNQWQMPGTVGQANVPTVGPGIR